MVQQLNLNDASQYTYTKGISTTDVLVKAAVSWKSLLDSKNDLVALSEDFSQTFDNMKSDILGNIINNSSSIHHWLACRLTVWE